MTEAELISLDHLIEVAKIGSETACKHEDLIPVLLMNTESDGIQAIGITTPGGVSLEQEKMHMEAAIRMLLQKYNPSAYVHVVEGWGTSFLAAAERVNGVIRDLPQDDRYDMAIITAVEKGNPIPVGYLGVIDTLRDGTRKIRSWEKSDSIHGRYLYTDW
jgi:hypothetical protein